MKEHSINLLDNFISGWYMPDKSICDKLIQYHEKSPDKGPGQTSKGIVKKDKDSIDCPLSDIVLLKEYASHLQSCVDEYIKKYHFCDDYAAWNIIDTINIQKYEPSGAYYSWHCERSGMNYPAASRHLVFMTYLNDVDDAGETEFYYQKIKVKPEKGLTLIWGADWTFTHRGVPSPSQEKYIITGWFNYIQ